MIDDTAVRAVLNSIIDPCSRAAGVPAGIVEMGLIRSLEVRQEPAGASITVTIRVTEPGCLMAYPFANEARKRLETLPGVASVDVKIDPVCDWEPAAMSHEYRTRLEAHRAQRRQAVNIQVVTRQEHAGLRNLSTEGA
jgi:metal-sulfur cluster biosynthetic enzyme